MIARKGDGRDHSIIPENIRRGSRFGRMMEAIQRGDTLEEMKEAFPGLEGSTYKVLHMIDTGTISQGSSEQTYWHESRALANMDAHAKEIYSCFDEGLTTKEVAERLGMSYDWARQWRTLWGYERGVTNSRRRN